MQKSISNYKFVYLLISILLLPIIFWFFSNISLKENQKYSLNEDTVVISEKSDAYYSLAEKIAKEDNLRIVENFSDILQTHPKYVILVASPENLTADRLYQIGAEFSKNDYYPAFGIITGSTQESAEQFWKRREMIKEGNNYLAGDTDNSELIHEPTIIDLSKETKNKIDLNKNSLLTTIQQADYIYWSRHTGARTWYWNDGAKNWGENDQLSSKDVPPIKPVVIYSPSCRVFQPWKEDSIVLTFIDQGAGAYLGFLNSPNANAYMRYGLSVPGINSWSEFPLGIVAQIGNKATTKAVFRSPQFFMMGDPRMYMKKHQPYEITSDTLDTGNRVLKGESQESGLLAVKVEDGAKYSFTHVANVSSISESDLFYNSKIQSLDLGEDKYLSFLHNGGEFEIILSPDTSFLWKIKDSILDVLDYSWVVLWLDNYSDSVPFIYALSIPALIGIIFIKRVKQKRPISRYKFIIIASIVFSLIRAGYFLIRLNEYTVIANVVSFTALDLVVASLGVFATTAGGLMIMKDAKTKLIIVLGLLLAVSRQLWIVCFRLVFNVLLSVLPAVSGSTQAWVWNFTDFWLRYTVLIIEISIILLLYYLMSKPICNQLKKHFMRNSQP